MEPETINANHRQAGVFILQFRRVAPYLEDAQSFSMGDTFGGSTVNGQDTVTLLNSPVAVGKCARDYLVNLEQNTNRSFLC